MPEPLQDGKIVFEQLRAEIEAVPARRLIASDMSRMAVRLPEEIAKLRSRMEVLAAPLNEAARAELEGWLQSFAPLLRAGLWLQANRDRQVLDASAFQRLLEEAQPIYAVGRRAVDVLELTGVLPSAEAEAIRLGRGAVDMAGDLQVMGGLLMRHWPTLEPLQALQPDPAARLSLEQITRMPSLGAELLEASRSRSIPADQEDWAALLGRLQQLMSARWERVRGYAAGAYAFAGEAALAAEGHPSLVVLAR